MEENTEFDYNFCGNCDGAIGCVNCAYTDKKENEFPYSECRNTAIHDTKEYNTRFFYWRPLTSECTNCVYCEGDCDINSENIKTPKEAVNHPDHYNQGGIECIDAIASAISELKGIEAFCTGNAIKYLWRWKDKNGIEDLNKAVWYIDYLIENQQ